MSKKTQPKHSNAGKGDKNRTLDKKRFDINWEKIFKPQVSGSKKQNNVEKSK